MASLVNKFFGPIMIGACLNAFFYGFSVLQFIQYRARFIKDPWPTQLLVTWTFLVDTVHTVALCWMLWQCIVDNFTNIAFLLTAQWPVTATPLFLAATAAPIQFYFARRVFILSRSRLLSGIIVALSLANNSMAIVAAVFAFTNANVHDFKLILPVIDSWLALSVACDGMVSCCLLFHVAPSTVKKRDTPLKNRVASLFIETSIITAIFALADLIIYSIVPNTSYHILLGIPMPRVYTCTFLAMLNARLKLQEDEADGIVSKQHRQQDFANAFNKMKRGSTQVRVDVSVANQEQVPDVVTLQDTQSISARSEIVKANGTESVYDGTDTLDYKARDISL